MKRIRKSMKPIALFMCINMFFELFFPTTVWALTGGPSQPEVQSFEPIGTSEMVDLFTGDFNYNIPLMDVEGYPINIAYHSGITMDQEASWVGLGWNINPGTINRNLKGLPDDFNNDPITKVMDLKPNISFGKTTGIGVEGFAIGGDFITGGVSLSLGVKYDNSRGVGYEVGLTPSMNISSKIGLQSSTSLSLSVSSMDGFDMGIHSSLALKFNALEASNGTFSPGVSASVGSSFNSRAGLKSLNLGTSASITSIASNDRKTQASNSINTGATITLNDMSYTPQISQSMKNDSRSWSNKIGSQFSGFYGDLSRSGYYSQNALLKSEITQEAKGYMYMGDVGADDNIILDYSREKDGPYNKQIPNLPITSINYDNFSVQGHGIAGNYRLFRNDIPFIYDPRGSNISMTDNKSSETGVPMVAKLGGNFTSSFAEAYSGMPKSMRKKRDIWSTGNINPGGTANMFGDRYGIFGFIGKRNNKPSQNFEQVYFKNTGEKTPTDLWFYNFMKGKDALAPVMGKARGLYPEHIFDGEKVLETSAGVTLDYNYFKSQFNEDKIIQNSQQRNIRNQMIQYLTAGEIISYNEISFNQQIKNYSRTDLFDPNNSYTSIQRVDGNIRKNHHISEITAIGPDGRRYVYGIPAYNNLQEELSFSAINPSNYSPSTGLYTYTKNSNTNNANKNNIDYIKEDPGISQDYFSKTHTPGYAHSYLLTEVLSPDYIDIGGDGVTDDDYGSAVKLCYSRTNAAYHWRTPYEQDKANMSEGFRSNKGDDMASIVYGEKELWNLKAIVSKNYVAVFTTEERTDGYGVLNIHGGKNTADKQHKLMKITLYAKKEYLAASGNSIVGENATPIKTVHFVYADNNELCQGAPNSNGGKLTLKKIYFTYGRSMKGKTTYYEFNYSAKDPGYHSKAYDRWGVYKPITTGTCNTYSLPTNPNQSTAPQNIENLTNAEYPYTDQTNRTEADLNASAWTLNSIKLPSGGIINITYEADDYAYVQNKQAMQMVKVVGMGNSIDNPYNNSNYGSTIEKLHFGDLNKSGSSNQSDDNQKQQYIYFEIGEVPPGYSEAEWVKEYLSGIGSLYFNFDVIIKPENINGTQKYHHENVQGFAFIDPSVSYGICSNNPNGSPKLGYVKLKEVSITDKENVHVRDKINPIAKAAFEFAREQTPYLVYPGYSTLDKANMSGSEMDQAFDLLGSAMQEISTLWKSPNKTMRDQSMCASFIAGRSFIRLNNPTHKKVGGGVRVKKVELNDKWGDMGGNNPGNAVYGTEYDYTTEETFNGKRIQISSGVASYEPMIGGEENPMRQPRFYTLENKMAPDAHKYIVEPIGESYAPSPSVGYSKVTVRNLRRGNNSQPLTKNATGYITTEFYTAKEFPMLTKEVKPKPQTNINNWHQITQLFSPKFTNITKASQGYSIVLNDMHGKMKSQIVYNEIGDIQTKTSYQYKSKENYTINPSSSKAMSTYFELDNMVKVYDYKETGNNVKDMMIATEEDIVFDIRENSTVNVSSGILANIEVIPFIVPFPIPVCLPSYKKTSDYFQSSTCTKVIYQYGLLESTKVEEENASITTKNVLYDAYTGEVLLTETQNEFSDPVYNLSYPAHFAYDNGMGAAYKNLGLELSGWQTDVDGLLIGSGLDFLVEGDEVLLYIDDQNQTQLKAWVTSSYTPGVFKLIDKEGNAIAQKGGTGIYTYLKVIRSGRRNMQSIPIAGVSLLNNPISGSNLNMSHNETFGVLNASATTFSDDWQMYGENKPGCNIYYYDCKKDELGFLNALLVGQNPILYDNSSNGVIVGNSIGNFLIKNSPLYIDKEINCLPNCSTYTIVSVMVPETTITPSPQQGTSYTIKAHIKVSLTPCNSPNSSAYIDIFYESGHTGNLTDQELLEHITSFSNKVNLPNMQGCQPEFLVDGVRISETLKYRCQIYKTNKTETKKVEKPTIYNPFLTGKKGIWRKKKDWVYKAERQRSIPLNTRRDGTYTKYIPFWEFSNNSFSQVDLTSSLGSKWIAPSTVTITTPHGNEVENQDALGIYSSAIYGYNHSQAKAIGKNISYHDMAYDGFEDYVFNFSDPCSIDLDKDFDHWNFLPAIKNKRAEISNSQAHTGKYSLKIPMKTKGDIAYHTKNSPINTEELVGKFMPQNGKYIISGWVKVDSRNALTSNYDDAFIDIILGPCQETGVTSTLRIQPSGPIIEGWQRIEGQFEITLVQGIIGISLIAPDEAAAYFDDLRIQPFNGNMKSYVYRGSDMRFMAELDENNFATFYEYDMEGQLMRVKKETVKGIVTLKEIKMNQAK